VSDRGPEKFLTYHDDSNRTSVWTVLVIPGDGIRWWCVAALSLFVLCCAGSSSPHASQKVHDPQAIVPLNPQSLSPAGQVLLRSLIQSANLPELHWPDFSAYRNDLTKFYESYDYALPWVRSMRPTPQAQAVITALQRADDKGLSADDYDGPRWAERLAKLESLEPQPTESEAVRFDLALTISLMRYISDLHTGRIDPHRFGIDVEIASRRYDLPEFLKNQIVSAADVPAVLARVEPPYPGYKLTLQALQSYRNLATEDTGQPLPAIKRTIAPGQSYAGVPQLARFLHLVGDLPASISIPAGQTLYQGALVAAVKRFQDRHGLTPDGRIDVRTLVEINVPLDRRVRQIQLTLERWRWLPPEYAESPIVVNIPGFHLRAYDRSFHIAVAMKVVVGKAYDHKTPIFMSNLQSVIFRPYWEVPVSIVREEVIPAINHDAEYLAKQEMEVVGQSGQVISTGTVTPDMLGQIYTGKLTVRQRPGPNNALGLIKFEFPNKYSVYMHDTPARLLFSQSKRDFSHGCIRLENAEELARWVLRDNPGWDGSHIQAAMNGDKTLQVKLAHPIPVLIVYGTAIVLEDRIVHFYDDLYGQDAELDQTLQQDYPYPH
jgi:L,D-transpeptidase YcbB